MARYYLSRNEAIVEATKAMTATSEPGFSLMQDVVEYTATKETPIVIVGTAKS